MSIINILIISVLGRLYMVHAQEGLNFHPLEVVSRSRDPQLQVGAHIGETKKLQIFIFENFYSH